MNLHHIFDSQFGSRLCLKKIKVQCVHKFSVLLLFISRFGLSLGCTSWKFPFRLLSKYVMCIQSNTAVTHSCAFIINCILQKEVTVNVSIPKDCMGILYTVLILQLFLYLSRANSWNVVCMIYCHHIFALYLWNENFTFDTSTASLLGHKMFRDHKLGRLWIESYQGQF